MKRNLLIFSLLAFISLCSCSNETPKNDDSLDNDQNEVITHRVSFLTGTEEEIEPLIVQNEASITKPKDPSKDGYKFIGWEYNGEIFDFENTLITSDITLKAKWERIENIFTVKTIFSKDIEKGFAPTIKFLNNSNQGTNLKIVEFEIDNGSYKIENIIINNTKFASNIRKFQANKGENTLEIVCKYDVNNDVTLNTKFINNVSKEESKTVGKFTFDSTKTILNYEIPFDFSFNDKENTEFISISFNGNKIENDVRKVKLTKKVNELVVYFKSNNIKDDFNCTPISELKSIASLLDHDVESENEYYAYGKISKITNATYGNFTLVDGNDAILVYGVSNWNKDEYIGVKQGDEVVLHGKLKRFNSNLEIFNANIVAIKRKVVEPPKEPTYGETTSDGKFTLITDNLYKVERIYDPKYIGEVKDYSTINKDEFYSNYSPATTYNDAKNRSENKLMSGDIKTPKNLPCDKNIEAPYINDGISYQNARMRYIYLDPAYSTVIGYIINDLDGDDSNDTVIFKNAAYISMDEVSAYLFAFNTVPINWRNGKNSNDKTAVINDWGKFGRVNNGNFENPRDYQPILTNDEKFLYKECDFGHDGNFYFYDKDKHPNVKQTIYNDGIEITRGTCRFCYTASLQNENSINLGEERHVFYTWKHYNEFQEYLNYKGGYGFAFGNLPAGNGYGGPIVNPVTQPPINKLAIFNK